MKQLVMFSSILCIVFCEWHLKGVNRFQNGEQNVTETQLKGNKERKRYSLVGGGRSAKKGVKMKRRSKLCIV